MGPDELSRDAVLARNDPNKLNLFIQNNNKFIKKCAYKVIGRYISDSDEEYSVAIRAFYEAVNSYDESSGAFSSFAYLVIKRRLYDYLKSEYRKKAEISVEPYVLEGELDEEDVSGMAIEVRHKMATMASAQDSQLSGKASLADEIGALQQMLSPYGFSFMDLTECSPHTDKTRAACAKAVNAILESDDLYEFMERKKALPMKELSKQSGVSKKILDRHRRYIIAAVLILNGEYPLLAEYMRYIKDTLKER